MKVIGQLSTKPVAPVIKTFSFHFSHGVHVARIPVLALETYHFVDFNTILYPSMQGRFSRLSMMCGAR